MILFKYMYRVYPTIQRSSGGADPMYKTHCFDGGVWETRNTFNPKITQTHPVMEVRETP